MVLIFQVFDCKFQILIFKNRIYLIKIVKITIIDDLFTVKLLSYACNGGKGHLVKDSGVGFFGVAELFEFSEISVLKSPM